MTGGVPLVGLAHKWGCTVTLRSCAGGLGGPWSGGALWPSGAVPGGRGGCGVGVHCGPQELCCEVWGAVEWGCTVSLRSCAGRSGGPWSGGALWPSGAVREVWG